MGCWLRGIPEELWVRAVCDWDKSCPICYLISQGKSVKTCPGHCMSYPNDMGKGRFDGNDGPVTIF